ncbi:early nodulin-75-like [Helianthus annuus]|uniref:early nodulin-75-like n=1 Tax=Helianthus annuus TaxID=4232 RepID=UPI000B907B7A|nr:early nodulin-75-like [Helianthus annuus]
MPPRVRGRVGRGKASVLTRNDHEAGPSHRRTPSASLGSSPHEDWRTYLEPVRCSVSLSSSPSYHDSSGLHQNDESDHSHHSFIPLQRSGSHHAFQDPTPYFQSRFNPMNQIQEPEGQNPLGPADHNPEMQDMEMDEDPDPEMLPTGTPTHPIEISSGSSFHGSPYRGPDIFAERWATYKWEYTPPHRNSPPHQQVPSEDPHFQAVTPPPWPAPEQQLPPKPPRRRRTGARMSVHGGFHFSTPQHSSNSHYPQLYEDPQMGGPSNPVSEVESAPVAPPLQQMGYDNPIPSYHGAAAYNPFEQQAYTGYNYNNAPIIDPYLEAVNYNALYPGGPFLAAYPTRYPAYGYQYPPPPQPQPQQQQPQIQPPQQQEIFQRLHEVGQKVEEEHRSRRGLLKGLASLIKGK